MSTVSADNYSKPPRVLPTGQISWGGQYTAANLAGGSTIQLAQLPKGAELQFGQLTNAALGANCTISFGTSAAPTLFAASIDGNTARTGTMYTVSPTVLQADTTLVITTQTVAATGAVAGSVVYTMDPAVRSAVF